jgi:hypothetical protein
MIKGIIEINPDQSRKLVTIITDPKERPNVILKPNQIIEKFNNQDHANKSIEDWNKSQELIKLVQDGKIELPPIKDPNDIDPNKVSDDGKRLINKAYVTNSDEDWLNVIRCHNQEKWSDKVYCCANEKLILRIRINKILDELEF